MERDNDLETLVVPDSDVSSKEEEGYTPICRTPSLKIKKPINPNCGTPITKKNINKSNNTQSEVVEYINDVEEDRTPIFNSLSPKIKKRINPDFGTVTKKKTKKSKKARSEVVEDISDVKNKEDEYRTPIFKSPSPKIKERINLDFGTVTKKKSNKSKKKTGSESENVNDINDVEKKENGCGNSNGTEKNGEKFESKFPYLNDVLERKNVNSTFMRMLTFFKEEDLNEMESKHEQAAVMQIEVDRLRSELVVKIH